MRDSKEGSCREFWEDGKLFYSITRQALTDAKNIPFNILISNKPDIKMIRYALSYGPFIDGQIKGDPKALEYVDPFSRKKWFHREIKK